MMDFQISYFAKHPTMLLNSKNLVLLYYCEQKHPLLRLDWRHFADAEFIVRVQDYLTDKEGYIIPKNCFHSMPISGKRVDSMVYCHVQNSFRVDIECAKF
jgi:phosphoribosylpyrophosphate synthetase